MTRTKRGETYAISKFRTVPLPFSMKATRISFSARATRASLSYFSYSTGTSSMNNERTILATDTKTANPDKPAAGGTHGEGYVGSETGSRRTWTDVPLGLETCYARETGHCDKVEECLRDMEHDHRFGDDHLRNGIVSRGTRCEWTTGISSTRRNEKTHLVFKGDDTLVSASDARERGGFVGWFQAVDETGDGV